METPRFKIAPTGGRRVFTEMVEIPISASNNGRGSFNRNELINNEYCIGVWVSDPKPSVGGAGALALGGGDIINADAFDAAYLSLMEDNSEVINEIPLKLIKQCNDQGRPYPLHMGKLNGNKSYAQVADVSLVTGTEKIVLVFEYLKIMGDGETQ